MAGHSFIGTDRIKKVWLGTTPIKKLYLGENMVFSGAMEYTFTGESELVGDPESDWMIYLKSSGTLNFDYSDPVDIFMIGGGSNGTAGTPGYGSGYNPGGYPTGGAGGDGGKYIQDTSGISLSHKDYEVVVGAAGQDTIFDVYDTSNGTESGKGGASKGAGSYNGNIGADGITAFDGNIYGAGGGEGGAGRDYSYSGGAGGNRGGGRGGNGNTSVHAESGQPATANTGSGGGGGAGWSEYYIGQHYAGRGGAGGSGIVIIRNHRE